MEPLSAFFFLEGIVFDMIGAIFIVRGLIPINPYELKNVKEIQEDFSKGLRYIIKLSNEVKQLKSTDDHVEMRHDNLMGIIKICQKESEQLGKAIPTQIRSLGSVAQHNRSLNYAIRGLSCLLGGFLLQAIAVVTQL